MTKPSDAGPRDKDGKSLRDAPPEKPEPAVPPAPEKSPPAADTTKKKGA